MIMAIVVLLKLAVFVATGHGIYRLWLHFSPPVQGGGNYDMLCSNREQLSHIWHTSAFGIDHETRIEVITLFWLSHIVWPCLLIATGLIMSARGITYVGHAINDGIIEKFNTKRLPKPEESKPEEPKSAIQIEAEEELEEYLNAS